MARRRNPLAVTPTVRNAPPTGRRSTRYPRHSWHIKFRPFQLQPMCIAPVAAGDSLKNIRFEARMLTDPILDQITGWWAEMYWFYVRFSDLEQADAARRLAVTPNDNLSGLLTTANTWTMHANSNVGPNWLLMCMEPIVRTHFRAENGVSGDFTIDGVPGAGLVGRSWLDTIELEANLPEPTATDDYEGRWEHYEALRKQKLITMDYPEYLASQGVAVPQQLVEPLSEKRRPELLRFTRQFAYPSNTVNPDGSGAASAVSWVVAERMDRPIFCDEPGFVVGITLVRPKLYRTNQRGAGVANIRDARTLVPDIFQDAPQESLVIQTGGGGAITTAVDYVHDVSGVYVLGDQFTNTSDVPGTALPDVNTLAKTYPVMADVDELFVEPGDASAQPPIPPAYYIRADGLASFSITGRKKLGSVTGYYTD